MGKNIFAVFLFVASLLAGCTPTSTENPSQMDGREYGHVSERFRHRWWNYYDRALSFAEGQYYREAIRDLEAALRKRGEDQRMARTYGMHFVDYFPHRELGIILYQQGNLDEARRHLELSLDQFPSARAVFYLDSVRKTQLEQSEAPATTPTLTLDPSSEIRTRDPQITIAGHASDPNLVSALSIDNAPQLFGAATESFSFATKIRLRPGANEIVVQAVNLLGGSTQRTIQVDLDQNGPLITIEGLETAPGRGRDLTIVKGTAFDEAGIETLVINSHPQPFAENREVFFTYPAEDSGAELEIRCRDRLGNETIVNLVPDDEKVALGPVRLAGVDSTLTRRLVAGALRQAADPQLPVIRLKGWADEQKVFLDRVFIEGEARDDSGVRELTLNGMPVMRRPGRHVFFNALIDLRAGANDIVVTAIDDAGNIVSKRISVIREIPAALQLAERMSLTVLPFDLKGDVSPLSDAFLDQVAAALFARNRFRIIEREKLDFILQEQKLSRTDLVDRRTALQVGKLVAAEAAFTGSIVESPQGYEIVARLIDTETSEILALTDVYDEGKSPETLRGLAVGLALKLHREFPLLAGSVLGLKGDSLFIDLGKEKTKLRRKFIVYREEPLVHPVTGRRLGSDNIILGRARVTQVMDDTAKADLVGVPEKAIQPMDRVLTE